MKKKKIGRPAGSKNKVKKSEGKKIGRPAGSKNKTSTPSEGKKRGRPAGSKNSTNKVEGKKRGRPAGSKNKLEGINLEIKRRGRPSGSKKETTHSSNGSYNFEIDYNWRPSKIYAMDKFLMDLVEKTKDIKPGGSIPIPVLELKNRYQWNNPSTMTNSLRNIFNKQLPESVKGRLSVHEQKDGSGNVNFIRVRRKEEN
jgi:hypothetical protein